MGVKKNNMGGERTLRIEKRTLLVEKFSNEIAKQIPAYVVIRCNRIYQFFLQIFKRFKWIYLFLHFGLLYLFSICH